VPVIVVFPAESVPTVERFPPVICPATPRPPAIVKAPDPVVVLTEVEVTLVLPETLNVPVIAVFPAFKVVTVVPVAESVPVTRFPEVS